MERQKDGEGEVKKSGKQVWQVGSGGGGGLVALVAGGGGQESACSQAQEGGGTHTPNHASAERGSKLTRVVGNETRV